MIQVNNLTLENSNETLLDNVSFTMNKKLNIIVGKSGSGKSTLALSFNGINKISSGTIKILDYQIDKEYKPKKKSMLRKDISYVWQMSDSQMFNSTVFNELTYNLKSFGLNIDEYKTEILKYLSIFNLPTSILHMSPFKLSGGQKKKIAIISSLIQNPKILILDEPTVSLDPMSKKEIISMLQLLDVIIIFITHDNEMLNILDEDSAVFEIKNKDIITYENVKEYLNSKFESDEMKLIPIKYHYGKILDVQFEDIYFTKDNDEFINKFGDICKIN